MMALLPGTGFLSEFLEDNPDLLYQAMRPRGSRTYADYFRTRQPQVTADYMGSIGRTAMEGQIPTQSYRDYLQNYPWRGEYLGQSPGARGEQPGLYAPRLKWNV